METFKPGICWAVTRKKEDGSVQEKICANPECRLYQLDSKTAMVAPGLTVRVWLCPKHRGLTARYYMVTEVTST